MCGDPFAASYQQRDVEAFYSSAGKPPEQLLADAFKEDLGITVDPQALRIFIRWRWDRVQKLAHKIHDAA